MNILISHSWLLDFLKTAVTPDKLASAVSLCGPSFERSHRAGRDTVYDIEVTTNRPDTASVVGIAREAGTILPQFGIKARFIDPYIDTHHFGLETTSPLAISIKAKPSTINRFCAIAIDNITIKQSPLKIRKRLESVGIRPINNLVDLTNYLMIETGQPLHAFDYDSIIGHTATITLSQKGESITTLDNKSHELPENAIIIRDQKRIFDLAGIMGGANSQITPQTKRTLLISAVYNPKRIRNTSLKLAHRTQAATLFEKGIDPETSLTILGRMVKIIKTYDPKATIASELIDIYPSRQKPKKQNLHHRLLENYLGITIAPKIVAKILNDLQFKTVYDKKTSTYTCTVPSHRNNDIEIEQDLIEEVARIYGYHRLPPVLPPQLPKPLPTTRVFKYENLIKNILTRLEFSEIYTSPLVAKELIVDSGFKPENTLKLTNPLNENAYMRTSLIPSMVQAVKTNTKYTPRFSLFETANIYLPQKNSPLPQELSILCLFTNDLPLSHFKGVVEKLLNRFSVKYQTKKGTIDPSLDQTQSITYSSSLLGNIASIGITSSADTEGLYGIIDLTKLLTNSKPHISFEPIPEYPPVIEDITLEVSPDRPIGEIINTIYPVDTRIKKISFVDLFAKGKKNALTLTLEIRDKKGTPTKEDAKDIKNSISKLFS